MECVRSVVCREYCSTYNAQEINKKMTVYVSKLAESSTEFETKDLAGKYSIEGLASCAFGVDSGSFDGDQSEFAYHGKKVFAQEEMAFKFIVCLFTPNLLKKVAAQIGLNNLFNHPFFNEHSAFLMDVVV